uniref:Uncharacterized protein n=1 Tax=Globodera rostochiensis TaxID=31243 RepID=A0A914HRJ3_GLORO
MSITKSTGRTPKLDKLKPVQLIKLDKLNPIQLITLDKLNPIQLITLDKLNPIQLITLDKLNPIQLITLDKLNPIQLITLDKLNPIQLIRILLSQNKTVAKELGLSLTTIYRWKRKLGQTKPQHKHSDSEQKELMKRYYEIKDQNPKMSVGDIAKNSVDGNSVEENATANVQKIGNSNSRSI